MRKRILPISIVVIFLITFIILMSKSIPVSLTNTDEGNKELSYYKLSDPTLILKKGNQGSFDSQRTHTMSIVEMNKNGYRFWAYYQGYDGKNIRHDMGLAYSNDLVNWVKEGTIPIVSNLRWGSAVVVDGTVHMFGTRNYGENSYIVRLSSSDGKKFEEQEKVVMPVNNEKHQNAFIFYDEINKTYRLYYYHNQNDIYYLEEKHSEDITQIGNSSATRILSDKKNILAAPSVMFRDGKYWLAAETLHEINGKKVWKTIMYVSDKPNSDFVPVKNHEILVDSDACYFQYIFDNKLAGVYSHEYDDGTWEMYLRTHEFKNKNFIKINEKDIILKVGETKKLDVLFSDANVSEVNVAQKATWAISDNSIISVKERVITGLKPGKATITVSFGGCSTVSTVEVK